jgi:hypothetical protein
VVVTALAFSLGTGAGVDTFPIAMLAFPLVGALIASHHPNNALGWVMLGTGMVAALDDVLIVIG